MIETGKACTSKIALSLNIGMFYYKDFKYGVSYLLLYLLILCQFKFWIIFPLPDVL